LLDDDGFEFVEADLRTSAIELLLDGVDAIFHQAAQAGVRLSWSDGFPDYLGHNVLATQRLLEAVQKARPSARVVYASSSSVYGNQDAYPVVEDALPKPYSPYGVTKLAGEHLCGLYAENSGIAAVSLRYFTVYGPRQRPDMAFHRFIRAALRGEELSLYGDGEQTRDFTFVADAVAATIAAGTRGVPGRSYNIGGGSRVSMNEVIAIIERIAGRPLNVRREGTQKGDMRDTYADTSLARQDLAFAPSVSLEEGIQAEFHWLSSTPALV
jgi:UDP-glucose 4-epimerase